MRVFVTGATGFIGSAVVQELLGAGHTVLGLARNDKAAETLAQMGVEAHRGDLKDAESLVAGATACDGTLHLAFIHDFANVPLEVAAETDRQVVEAMVGALEGTNKPFVLTSGTALLAFALPPGQIATENDNPAPNGRGASEAIARATAERGVRSSIVRLSPSVHGAGDYGFVPMLIDVAKRTGVSAYVGEGQNRWPGVHRLDAAKLYRLALENAAPGANFHGVAEEGVPMRTIAETIGAGLGVPVRSLGADEAKAHFTWMAGFVGLDNPTSNAITRATLGWNPQGPDLLTDLRENGYFV